MLDGETIIAARHIAELAKAARAARDRVILAITERDLGEPPPERGEPQSIEALGLEAVPPDEPAHRALGEGVERLPDELRRRLWAIMRTGAGDYVRGDWPQALADAEAMPDDAIIVELAEEAELPQRLAKGLFELGVAQAPSASG
jgi:hypothetical protein